MRRTKLAVALVLPLVAIGALVRSRPEPEPEARSAARPPRAGSPTASEAPRAEVVAPSGPSAPPPERSIARGGAERPGARVAPVVAPHGPGLDGFYEGRVMDAAAYLARADRRLPRVDGCAATQEPFEVQVRDLGGADPMAPPLERVLFADGSGTFSLRLAPGRYALRLRLADGRLSPGRTVHVTPSGAEPVELAPPLTLPRGSGRTRRRSHRGS